MSPKTRISTLATVLSILILSGCNLGVSAPAEEPSAEATITETAMSPEVQNEAQNVITFDEMGISVSFNYAEGMSQGFSNSTVPVYENYGPTELPYPQHARILFTAYTGGVEDHRVSGIRVFRTDEVDALQAGIIEKLNAVMNGQIDQRTDFPLSGAPALNVSTRVQQAVFQNGNGYRFLYATSGFIPLPLKSTELTLMYQGMTTDGKYFVSLILPVEAPFLNEFLNQPIQMTEEEFNAHYQAVNERINSAAPDEFVPSLTAVDEMIASITITEK